MQSALNFRRVARNMIPAKAIKLIYVSLVGLILMLPVSALASGSVNLRWNANTEPDLSHYNVYCGTASRNYGNPIPVGKVTSHPVDGLQEGTTYFCALTAVDTSGNESGYSSEVSATAVSSIPDPPPVPIR